MTAERRAIAKLLREEHPGLPSDEIAAEIVESCYAAMKRYVIKNRELNVEGVGRLEVKEFRGSEKKRDARTGIVYKVTPRNVLKFKVSDNLKNSINISRKPSQPVGSQ